MAYAPDEQITIKGFIVEIDGGGTGKDADSMWETCSGGGLNIEVADASTGSDKYHETTPGHTFIDNINLRGPMTPGRQALCQWIMDTVAGKAYERKVVITELDKEGQPAKSYTYHECFICRYVFPVLSASGTGNLYEEVEIKAIRMDLEG